MSTAMRLLIRLTFRPTLWFSRLACALGGWRRWDWVDSGVLLGAAPSRADLPRLKALGITAVVNMCDEFAGHTDALAACRLIQLRLPTVDYHCPNEADLVRGVAFIRRHVAAGGKVYVHCKAGRGRAPTLAVCYLIAERGLAASEALASIKSSRPQASGRIARKHPVIAFERRFFTRPHNAPPPTEETESTTAPPTLPTLVHRKAV